MPANATWRRVKKRRSSGECRSQGCTQVGCRRRGKTDGTTRRARMPLGHETMNRVADAAAVRVLLVAAERRVGRHRPTVRKVIVRLRPADVLEPRHLLRLELGPHVARAQRDASEQSALRLAPLSERTRMIVLSRCPALSRKSTRRASWRSA